MLLHRLIARSAEQTPAKPALRLKGKELSYAELWAAVNGLAAALLDMGLARNDRVAVYLGKEYEAVIGMFAAAAAGAVFVPVNPGLKAKQVGYILRDCTVRCLITSSDRARSLAGVMPACPALEHLIVTGGDLLQDSNQNQHRWREVSAHGQATLPPRIDTDMAAILYTSGSTGNPKGVVLSHRNMVCGALSVAEYLENTPEDRILAILPFSFDYGLSQLTTAFSVGASVVMVDYLRPRDVVAALARERCTGLAAVPPVWNQLVQLEWAAGVAEHLRYITNSGGAMPLNATRALQQLLPRTSVYLMYGLTEAFRSTYLPPSEVTQRPESMGKAIPNAEIMVVREDGSECAVDEPGELVHRGSLVALGYWNDAQKTAERFKPAPGQPAGLVNPELAVWSGDRVRRDADDYLYFVGRADEMIKTSGYRVSPTEVEEELFASGMVSDAAAFGVTHTMLGQAIIAVCQAKHPGATAAQLIDHCKKELPSYMVPSHIELVTSMPKNPNGKIDRSALRAQLADHFVASPERASETAV